MNRMLLLAATVLVFLSAAAGTDAQKAADRFAKTSGVPAKSLAVKVTDLSDGKVLASVNSSEPLVPASIMKSVTTASLLGEVGPDYRYRTVVGIDGPVEMGVLRGNLTVEGSGDPSLHSPDEPGSTNLLEEIAGALRSMGILRIEGTVIVDDSYFAGPSRPASWAAGDLSQSYGTGSHSFNFEGNASGRRSVERPDLVFAGRLKSRLLRDGVEIIGKDLGEGERRTVYTHHSEPLDEIMRSCMMRSDNLYAESMFRTFGKVQGGSGSHADTAPREELLWQAKGLPMEGVAIADGSGLSRSNRMTADFMSGLLAQMSDDAVYASFFPLAGQEGTLRKFLAGTPLEGYLALKTGSMNGIQCYAGYKLDGNYVPTHTVVIMMNGLKNRDKAKGEAEKMLLEIFGETIEIHETE